MEKAEMTEFSEINALFQRVDKEKPKHEDVEKLREVLTKYPPLSQIGGDLVKQVERQLIEHALPTQQGARISIERYCEYQRNELGFETATPLERSLIAHVVLCWLRLYVTELRYESRMEENLSLPQGAYWEKKLSANQRRYLRSVETLARIRKLSINVQINMAHQQIVT